MRGRNKITTHPQKHSFKQFGFWTLATFIAISIVIISGEAFLRLSNVWIGRHSDTTFELVQYDSLLGWKMKPGLNQKAHFVDVENIPIRSNSLGFWDEEFRQGKSPDQCRIIFLGDSFTWGMGVQEEERFSNLLEKENSHWESLNFGIPGYGVDQSFLVWRTLAYSYQADAVVLTIYENDYTDNMSLIRYGRQKPYFEMTNEGQLIEWGIPVDSADFWDNGIFNQIAPLYAQFFERPLQKRSRVMHWLAKNSDFVRFFYTRFRSISVIARPEGPKQSTDSQISLGALRPLIDEREQKQVELLTALVNQLTNEISASGARLIVTFAGRLKPEHQTAMKLLREKQIPVVDLTTEVLESQSPSKDENIYYSYSKHWTPAAHQAVAKILAQTIQENNLCNVTD